MGTCNALKSNLSCTKTQCIFFKDSDSAFTQTHFSESHIRIFAGEAGKWQQTAEKEVATGRKVFQEGLGQLVSARQLRNENSTWPCLRT